MQKFITVFLVLLFVPDILSAADIDRSKNQCWSADFLSQSADFAQAVVIGKENKPVPFQQEDSKSCPNKNLLKCAATYMFSGEKLIAAKNKGEFVCVWRPLANMAGWTPQKNLKKNENKIFNLNNWVGEWINGENKISINKNKNDLLHFQGNAIWRGTILDNGEQNIHSGEFEILGRPRSNKVRIINGNQDYFDAVPSETEQSYCEINLTLLDDYLLATDNKNCGGANVAFDGIYQKKKE